MYVNLNAMPGGAGRAMARENDRLCAELSRHLMTATYDMIGPGRSPICLQRSSW